MKIKSDFVTNSSSTCFVVAFNKVPKDWLELQRMMFGTETSINEFSTLEIVKRVWGHIECNKGMTFKQVKKRWYCEWNTSVENITEESFYENNKDATFYEFEFSDHDGEFDAFLEHSDIFRNLPHVVIDCH